MFDPLPEIADQFGRGAGTVGELQLLQLPQLQQVRQSAWSQLWAACKQESTLEGVSHRRRTNTEEKAKVVAAVWGMEIIQFHAELQI